MLGNTGTESVRRVASAFSSRTRSFIAARSSSVNPLTGLPATVALLADFCASVFGLIASPYVGERFDEIRGEAEPKERVQHPDVGGGGGGIVGDDEPRGDVCFADSADDSGDEEENRSDFRVALRRECTGRGGAAGG